MEQFKETDAVHDEMRDARTSHPVGTGLGAGSGAVTGALAGTAIGGPAGTLVGAVLGAIGGALAGREVAEQLNPAPGGPGPDHPVATSVGASGGTLAGAMVGSFAGPVGTAIGAAAGAAAGAVAGEGVGEVLYPKPGDDLTDRHFTAGAGVGARVSNVADGSAGGSTVGAADHDAYWSRHHADQMYAVPGRTYDDYEPAYRLGYTRSMPGRDFDADADRLESEWEAIKGRSRLSWHEAKAAVRAAWHRAANAMDRAL